MFKGPTTFYEPAEYADGGIDPNAHPHKRTGETLKSRWSDVRFSFCLFRFTACLLCLTEVCGVLRLRLVDLRVYFRLVLRLFRFTAYLLCLTEVCCVVRPRLVDLRVYLRLVLNRHLARCS